MLSFDFWSWWILGGFLLVGEILVPGAFMLWVALAAFLVGFVDYLLPLPVWAQLMLFASFSILSVVIGKRYRPSLKDDSDYPNLNDRGAQYVGEVFVLSKAIVDGRGKAKVGDTEWIVVGPDLPQGSQVKITGVEGTFLRVKSAD